MNKVNTRGPYIFYPLITHYAAPFVPSRLRGTYTESGSITQTFKTDPAVSQNVIQRSNCGKYVAKTYQVSYILRVQGGLQENKCPCPYLRQTIRQVPRRCHKTPSDAQEHLYQA